MRHPNPTFVARVFALSLVSCLLACESREEVDPKKPGAEPTQVSGPQDPEPQPPAVPPDPTPGPPRPEPRPPAPPAAPPAVPPETTPGPAELPDSQEAVAVVEPATPTEPQPCQGSLGHQGLLTDLMRYKTTNVNRHAGDLYEHSVWIAKAVEKWFDQQGPWTEGLGEADRCIAVVAAFLHDIGKAGDNRTRFGTKPGHADTGRGYLLGDDVYRLEDGAGFDFDGWFEQLGLGQADKEMVAFLVAVHRALSEEIMEDTEHPESCADLEGRDRSYLDRLASTWDGNVDERLARLAMLVGAADVLAMQPVRHPSTLFTRDLPDDLEPPHEGRDNYRRWDYDSEGILVRHCVLEQLRQASGAG